MFPKSEIVVRSTIDPSSLKKLKSDVQENTTMWFYPEYLREGNALSDILKNPNHICRLAGSGTLLEKLLNEISFKFEFKDAYAASFNKIISNVWRANKISFMNACLFEAANLNINLKDFNELFLNDPKNTSGSYLGLGGPFGGYCLPKETQHLVNSASQSSLPIWKSTLEINDNVINKIIDYFVNLDDDFDYCFIDLAFKEGTDDERNSPYFKIAQKLNSINPNKYRFCQDGTQMKISGSGATNSSAKYVMAKWYEFCI
jgi:GDP-mannose 6-dehydrogenase